MLRLLLKLLFLSSMKHDHRRCHESDAFLLQDTKARCSETL